MNGKGRYVTNPDGDLGAFLNPHGDYGVLPEKALPSRFTCKEEHKGHQEHYQHVELSTEGILDLVRLQCKVIWCVIKEFTVEDFSYHLSQCLKK